MFKVTMQSEILQNTMTDPGDFQFFPALWVQSSRSHATSQWTSLLNTGHSTPMPARSHTGDLNCWKQGLHTTGHD